MNTLLGGRLIVAAGDITTLAVDAIVNAANSSLMGGGGVDGAIHRAGGPAILAECRAIRRDRYPDGLPPGEAVETTGGSLPARFVIHTVGPVWHGGTSGEEQTLAACYRNCLLCAARIGLQSIAFPAISTGVYGFPRERAARVVWKTVSTFLADQALPRTVTLQFFSPGDMRIFLRECARFAVADQAVENSE
jgi:O-acetyl-ADP-ribose deacetylase (regulator of RNase III)